MEIMQEGLFVSTLTETKQINKIISLLREAIEPTYRIKFESETKDNIVKVGIKVEGELQRDKVGFYTGTGTISGSKAINFLPMRNETMVYAKGTILVWVTGKKFATRVKEIENQRQEVESIEKSKKSEGFKSNFDKILSKYGFPKEATLYLYELGKSRGYDFSSNAVLKLSKTLEVLRTTNTFADFTELLENLVKDSGEIFLNLFYNERSIEDDWQIKVLNLLKKVFAKGFFVEGWEEGTSGIGISKDIKTKVKEAEYKTRSGYDDNDDNW